MCIMTLPRNVVQVCQALEALQQHHSLVKSKRKPQLVEDNPLLSLIIALRKIPDRTIRPHRMYKLLIHFRFLAVPV